MKRALGLVEVFGLVAAVTVADDMVKCADVELVGYELAKGSGMATIKILGDVGAVQAAISCGEASAKAMNMFVGKKVIPRPADGLEMLINNSLTVGYSKPDQKPSKKAEEPPKAGIELPEIPLKNKPRASSTKSSSKPAAKPAAKPETKPAAKSETKPAAKPETKPAAKLETKPAAKPETKPETKPLPEQVPEQVPKPENVSSEAPLDIKEDMNGK